MKKISALLLLVASVFAVTYAQNINTGDKAFGMKNPLVPGYFADPSVKKFGDLYYIYATTDGVMLASGEPTVWVSNDFVNWYNYELSIPMLSGLSNNWAPDVIQGKDGRYYFYNGNCENGCNIYGYVADSPLGPFTRLNATNKPVIPVNVPKNGFPSLDAQFLQDGDSLYAFFGTWCANNGGMGFVKIKSDDMKTIESQYLIPAKQLPEVFEGAYPLKKNNKYILMYSSGDCQLSDYRVQYAYANAPKGPYTFGANNPILAAAGKSVDGPGHHSVLSENNAYFIVYHRHNNPHTGGGEFRQLCADSLFFENDSTIRKVVPSHTGIDLHPNMLKGFQIESGKASATSTYHLQSKTDDLVFDPAFAIDNNNGTLWKAADNTFPQALTIDIGVAQNIKRITTEFEYTTYYYQYKIEYSNDSANWQLFADNTANRRAGCPMIDDADVNARYFRIIVTGAEKSGLMAAIWNIKLYDNVFDLPVQATNAASAVAPGAQSTNSMLANLNIDALAYNALVDKLPNSGTLGGQFLKVGKPTVTWVDSLKVISFNGTASVKLSVAPPASLAWNGSYTVATWVKNPKVGGGECLACWTNRNTFGLMNSYAGMYYGWEVYGAAAHLERHTDMPYLKVPKENQWHFLVLTFDGMVEKMYVDGVLDNSQNLSLSTSIQTAKILIGTSDAAEGFSGYMASLKLYDKALSANDVLLLMDATKPQKVSGPEVGIPATGNKHSKINAYYRHSDDSIILQNNTSAPLERVTLNSVDGRLIANYANVSNPMLVIKSPGAGAYLLTVLHEGNVSSQKIIVE